MFVIRHLRVHFNSQPHKEADGMGGVNEYKYNISIHSLTRRLTVFRQYSRRSQTISIHSLTRRLTVFNQADVNYSVFQFTASQGG